MMRKLAVFFIFLFFLASTGYLAYNHSQSERFGDETAHFIGGHFINKGKRLYQDMQFNHMPLPYFFSAITEHITQPKNLYLFVARQRESIFIYSALWNFIFYFIFGQMFFLFILVFEIAKYFFQGYKVLNETIATYPLIFMFGVTVESFIYKKIPSKFTAIIFSVAAFIVSFSLLPLWIVIIPLFVILLYSLRKRKSLWKFVILPFCILIFILSYFVSFPHLFKESIINNFVYFLPNSGGKISFVRMISLPYASFFPPYSPAKLLVGLLTIFTLLSLFTSLQKRVFKKYVIVVVLLMLVNFFRVDDYGFGNFHLLPWIAILIALEIFWIKNSRHTYVQYKLIVFVFFITYLFLVSGKTLYAKRNLSNDFYVNYSESESYGKAVMVLNKTRDRLLVMNDPIIYWTAQTSAPTRVLEYYSWVYYMPEYKKELIALFRNNPPEFIIDTGLNPRIEVEKNIRFILETDYQNIYHVGKPSRLYIYKDRVNSISEAQRDALKEILYTL